MTSPKVTPEYGSRPTPSTSRRFSTLFQNTIIPNADLTSISEGSNNVSTMNNYVCDEGGLNSVSAPSLGPLLFDISLRLEDE